MQRALSLLHRSTSHRAFSQLAYGKNKKFVLTGADGNLGRVAADYMVDIAKPEEQVVITSYDLKLLPVESIKRWESKGAIMTTADYDDVEVMKRVFDGAEAVALISTWRFGMGRRIQAKNVCDAAKAVGVKRACYTSFVGGGIEMDVEEEIPFLATRPSLHRENCEGVWSRLQHPTKLVVHGQHSNIIRAFMEMVW